MRSSRPESSRGISPVTGRSTAVRSSRHGREVSGEIGVLAHRVPPRWSTWTSSRVIGERVVERRAGRAGGDLGRRPRDHSVARPWTRGPDAAGEQARVALGMPAGVLRGAHVAHELLEGVGRRARELRRCARSSASGRNISAKRPGFATAQLDVAAPAAASRGQRSRARRQLRRATSRSPPTACGSRAPPPRRAAPRGSGSGAAARRARRRRGARCCAARAPRGRGSRAARPRTSSRRSSRRASDSAARHAVM